MADDLKIGLALSGGGSRAIAFHLGCLRALHDRGLLSKVSAISSVSGGSVIAALWSYSDDDFPDFDAHVTRVLQNGLTKGIVRNTLFSPETPKILATLATSGVLVLIANILATFGSILVRVGWTANPLSWLSRWIFERFRRYASRSTAFERSLRRSVFGTTRMDEVKRPNLNVVINASELRTGTAFRYGSMETGCWTLGRLTGDAPHVSQAVASSAAFPALLPAFDQILEFERQGEVQTKRVLISDGGVYENLGISCLLPDRNPKYATNVLNCDFIICCDAGHGQPSGEDLPYHWAGRMSAAVNSIFRRATNQGYGTLHSLAEAGKIKGFVLPYLGQQDTRLPFQPSDLVTRDQVISYPTDFSPMTTDNIELLSKRGEQMTRILIDHYHPGL